MEITSNKSGTDFMSAPLLYFKKQNAILYRCDFHAFTVIGVLVHHPVALAAQIEQRKGQIGAIPFQRGRRFVFIVGGNAVAYVARQTVFVKYADRIVFLRREFDSHPAGMFHRFFQIFFGGIFFKQVVQFVLYFLVIGGQSVFSVFDFE